ncbi:MAG TPA: alpha/beta hydrolase-fold protein [Polyangiaceae bacterium]|nr:alpha/beta hydrolase-fold protein [Polyangiaceae bacterium]
MGPRSAPRTSRRALLGALVSMPFGSAPGVARAEEARGEPPDLTPVELALEGDPKLSRSAMVLVPRERRADERFPILLLFHGLGETGDPKIGVRAWADRYGLVTADARLRHAPLSLAKPNRYVSEDRLARINGELGASPYRGAVLVCPFTPNIHKLPSEAQALDRLAEWTESTLLPAVRAQAPCREDPGGVSIDGCSLGGYMALGVFLRKPELFGAVGSVQPAIGEKIAPLYADLLKHAVEKAGPRSIHIETSSWDPELPSHQALSERLRALRVPHDYTVLPGGHDQIFLKEIGTLEMLLWHDRRFAEGRAPQAPGG